MKTAKPNERDSDSIRQESSDPASEEQQDSGIITLVLFWSFVGIPLIWGVIQTFEKAMQLFR